MTIVLNDVHSALNPTPVRRVERPRTLDELRSLVHRARSEGFGLSVAGGRHAMGAQQFATNQVHVDTTAMCAVLGSDASRGWLRVEAGAMWPAIIEATHRMPASADGTAWAIRQKQTGVDDVTLGGSIAANAHGRGLQMQPLVDDIEDLALVDPQGDVVTCSRTEHPELFAKVVGGYGLFGIVHAATLRLTPRRKVRRLVDVLDLADARHAVLRRVEQGCLYGDFQFVIDPRDPAFLQRGVFACYRPVDADDDVAIDAAADLRPEDWLKLLRLAAVDKAAAFKAYAQHYLGTHGNAYWADTMQLATYLPSYADALSSSFMPWARDDYACVIFNLRTPHTPQGKQRTADTFRALIDTALALDGSYFLTYHHHATREQVLRAYPQMPDFFAAKRAHDPHAVFVSDWYHHHTRLLEAA
ncbi:MAG: FAD-binding oxidoreductase [Burkholderiaceae bacterium]|nr:FAD-binding oxidoreductase [Burkholderiaceae bacterium]